MPSKQQGKLLILNWPFCSDTYAIADIFAQVHGFVHIDGPSLLKNIQIKTKDKKTTYNDIHADILREISKQLDLWKDVIVSQTILPSYEVLYDYYFHKNHIEAEMIILLPKLDKIFQRNKQLKKSFDEEYLEEIHQLFTQEESWTKKLYQYNGDESAIQIAETLHMCFCPQEQKQSFFDTPFATQKLKIKSHFICIQ